MNALRVLSACFFLTLIAVLIACGSKSGLQSLSINPATADAQNFPNGQVQFTAMGTYSGSSQPTQVKARWWSFTPWTTPPPAATTPTPTTYTLTDSGIASCLGTGTFTLWATAPANQQIPPSQMTASTRQLTATAQLTCP